MTAETTTLDQRIRRALNVQAGALADTLRCEDFGLRAEIVEGLGDALHAVLDRLNEVEGKATGPEMTEAAFAADEKGFGAVIRLAAQGAEAARLRKLIADALGVDR